MQLIENFQLIARIYRAIILTTSITHKSNMMCPISYNFLIITVHAMSHNTWLTPFMVGTTTESRPVSLYPRATEIVSLVRLTFTFVDFIGRCPFPFDVII